MPPHFRQSPLPLSLPNTHSQWVPACFEHPSLAQHSWSGPSFSILRALLLASENLEAEVLGKAVAVTVVQLQQPGQFEPVREKPLKSVNTVLHQALWQNSQKNVLFLLIMIKKSLSLLSYFQETLEFYSLSQG